MPEIDRYSFTLSAVPHGSITFVKPERMNVQARINRQTLASSLNVRLVLIAS